MTAKQRDFLASLAKQLGVIFDEDLTKAEAAFAIDHFRSKLRKRWRKAKSEPMSEAQKRYLQYLCERSGRDFEPTWTKVQASSAINFMLGRGQHVQGEEEEPHGNQLSTDDDSDFVEAFVQRSLPSQGRRGPETPEY